MFYADVNGDGRADLVRVNHAGTNVAVHLGRTDGTWGGVALNGYDPGWGSAGKYGLADINGDGRTELVFAADNGMKRALFFKADGAVERQMDATTIKRGERVFGEQLFADINGDGITDSLWRDTQNRLSVALGSQDSSTGRISFGAWKNAGFTAPTGASFDDHLLAADINGDRKADLLWVKPSFNGAVSGDVQLYRNTGTATTVSWSPLNTAGNSAGMSNAANGLVSLTDVNGDGRLDLLRTMGHSVKAWLGMPSGSLGSETTVNLVTEVVPAGGSVLNLSGLSNTQATLIGSPGNDRLVGTAWSDILDGGSGNDILEGGGGNDIYHFGYGSGRDRIIDTSGAEDTLLVNARIEDIVLDLAHGGDLLVALDNRSGKSSAADYPDHVTLVGQSSSPGNRIEFIAFNDGTRMDLQKLVQAVGAFADPSTGEVRLRKQEAYTAASMLASTSLA
jgi:Ca2+-binding RTX toxin-like protein